MQNPSDEKYAQCDNPCVAHHLVHWLTYSYRVPSPTSGATDNQVSQPDGCIAGKNIRHMHWCCSHQRIYRGPGASLRSMHLVLQREHSHCMLPSHQCRQTLCAARCISAPTHFPKRIFPIATPCRQTPPPCVLLQPSHVWHRGSAHPTFYECDTCCHL